MKRVRLLLGALVFTAASVLLAACGSSGDSDGGSKGQSPTPSVATSSPLPLTITPVPDNLTAEQLRLLMLAAGERVTTMKWEYRYGTDGEPSEYQATPSLTLRTSDAQNLSPPLNPTDKVDVLDTAEGKRYWRVNDGPWRFDPDAPLNPDPFLRFPHWAQFIENPVGGQTVTSMDTRTVTYTVTGLSISPAANRGSDRCWVLTVSGSVKQTLLGQQDKDAEGQYILTACEPDFLVTTYTGHPVSGYDPGVKDSLDTYLYNTGDAPAIPTQVVEVHCPPYDRVDQQRLTCMYK